MDVSIILVGLMSHQRIQSVDQYNLADARTDSFLAVGWMADHQSHGKYLWAFGA
jgi:hypothetical protein